MSELTVRTEDRWTIAPLDIASQAATSEVAFRAKLLGRVYIHRVQRTTATMLIIAAKQVSVFS